MVEALTRTCRFVDPRKKRRFPLSSERLGVRSGSGQTKHDILPSDLQNNHVRGLSLNRQFCRVDSIRTREHAY